MFSRFVHLFTISLIRKSSRVNSSFTGLTIINVGSRPNGYVAWARTMWTMSFVRTYMREKYNPRYFGTPVSKVTEREKKITTPRQIFEATFRSKIIVVIIKLWKKGTLCGYLHT